MQRTCVNQPHSNERILKCHANWMRCKPASNLHRCEPGLKVQRIGTPTRISFFFFFYFFFYLQKKLIKKYKQYPHQISPFFKAGEMAALKLVVGIGQLCSILILKAPQGQVHPRTLTLVCRQLLEKHHIQHAVVKHLDSILHFSVQPLIQFCGQ